MKITTTPAAVWRPRTARQDTEQQCPLCFLNATASLGQKIQGNFEMSAGSKCLENMIAGRPQHIMVILRNQSNNKENLPRTHDSKFWSQPFSFEGVHIRPTGSEISRSPQEQHGDPQQPDKTEESGVRCVFSMKLLRKFQEISECLQDQSVSKI